MPFCNYCTLGIHKNAKACIWLKMGTIKKAVQQNFKV
jgi:hypothetical protein